MGCACCKQKHESFSYNSKLEEPLRYNDALQDATPRDTGTEELNEANVLVIAANYCRESGELHEWLHQPHLHIGSRPLKWHFMTRGRDSDSGKRTKMMMSMTAVPHSSELNLASTAVVDALANTITAFRHPSIIPTEDVDIVRDRNLVLVFRRFADKGSLKDYINGKVNPKDQYDAKYTGSGRALAVKRIQKWGRQILEGLIAFETKGFVFDNLHTGNILLENGDAKISDYETSLMGMRPHGDLHALTLDMEQTVPMNALLFGHVLFEMAYGTELTTETPDFGRYRFEPDPMVREVLERIFFPTLESINEDETADGGVQDSGIQLEDLLALPLFRLENAPKPTKLMLSSAEKGFIRSAVAANAARRQRERDLAKPEPSADAAMENGATSERKPEYDAHLEQEAPHMPAPLGRRGSRRVAASRKSGRRSLRLDRGSSARGNLTHVDLGEEENSTTAAPVITSRHTTTGASYQTNGHLNGAEAEPNSSAREASSVDSGGTGGGAGGGSEAVDPRAEPYVKLLKIGLARAQVEHKMQMDGVDPALLPGSVDDGGAGAAGAGGGGGRSPPPPPPSGRSQPPPPAPEQPSAPVAPPVAKPANLLSAIRGFDADSLSAS